MQHLFYDKMLDTIIGILCLLRKHLINIIILSANTICLINKKVIDVEA